MDLTPIHREIFDILKTTPLVHQFYWTGGTLLSHYYLHHRYSFDLDFFSDTPVSYNLLLPFIEGVKQHFQLSELIEKKIGDRWEFLIDEKSATRIEFVHYNHEKKRLGPLSTYLGVFIDSLPDLAANKVMAYVDRNEPKDLFDVYTLLTQKKYTVTELLVLVKKKFGANFSEFMFWSEAAKSLKNLPTFKPFFLEKDPHKQEKIILEVERYFLDQGSDYLKRHLG